MQRTFYIVLISSVFGWVVPASSQSLQDTTASLREWYLTATGYMENYQFDPALEYLTRCYRYDSENKDYLAKIAYCHQQMGRYKDAKMYYQAVLKQDSTHARALSAMASIYTRESNHLKAQEYYGLLIRVDSTNSYYFKQAAYTALRRNQVFDGVRLFLKAHELNPEDLEVIDQLADIYIALDQVAAAEQMVQFGLNLDAQNIKLLYNQARLFQKKKEHAQVIESINKAMEQGDTTDYYQMMIGVAYLKLDSFDQAIFHLREIEKRDKATDRTFHYLGLAYFNKEHFDSSKYYLELAIESGIAPQMDAYYADLASLHQQNQDLRNAIAYYKKAIEFDAKPEYVFHLAHASDKYYKSKSIAVQHYQAYLRTGDPAFRDYATKRLQQLKEIIHFQGN